MMKKTTNKRYLASVRNEEGKIQIIEDTTYSSKKHFADDLRRNGYKVRFISDVTKDEKQFDIDCFKYNMRYAPITSSYEEVNETTTNEVKEVETQTQTTNETSEEDTDILSVNEIKEKDWFVNEEGIRTTKDTFKFTVNYINGKKETYTDYNNLPEEVEEVEEVQTITHIVRDTLDNYVVAISEMKNSDYNFKVHMFDKTLEDFKIYNVFHLTQQQQIFLGICKKKGYSVNYGDETYYSM